MKRFFFIFILFSIIGCTYKTSKKSGTEIKSEYIYSYSVLAGINNSIYGGDLTIAELKTKGDIGIGTYENLNGEMVLLDGTPYQVVENGTILEASDKATTPYAVVTFFEKDDGFKINKPINLKNLKTRILETLPSENYFYAFKIKGKFSSVICGGAPKQDKPYTKTLSEILATRPQFTAENISGTIVGFYCPAYVGEVTLAGFHLHFIADNKKLGGHIIDFESSELEIFFDETKSMTFDLQDNDSFKKTKLKSGQGY